MGPQRISAQPILRCYLTKLGKSHRECSFSNKMNLQTYLSMKWRCYPSEGGANGLSFSLCARAGVRGARFRKGPGLGSGVCLSVCLCVCLSRPGLAVAPYQRVSGEVGISGRGPAGWFQNAEILLLDAPKVGRLL